MKIQEIIRNDGPTPAQDLIKRLITVLGGWVDYFRVGNSSRAFSSVRDYLETKVLTFQAKRKLTKK